MCSLTLATKELVTHPKAEKKIDVDKMKHKTVTNFISTQEKIYFHKKKKIVILPVVKLH